MTVILFRTGISYLLLLCVVRLMGKRQIGELQMTEFISAMLLSQAAVFPMTDPDIPLLFGILPLVCIGSLEVILAMLCAKSTAFRHFLEGKPITLVENGAYLDDNLTRTRISREEVLSQIRNNGYTGLEEVDKVILEPTGNMSVLPADGTGTSARTGGTP